MSAYNCRAVLLLQKELVKLNKLQLWGVDVDILDDDIFTWTVVLSGLKGTSWEGSRLKVEILFSEEYNFTPPHVSFQTIPMHPNVDSETGTVCLDCLVDWNNNYSMSYVILSLQCMLSEPSMYAPLNANAARLATVSPNHYKQITLDCVLDSQKIKRPIETPDVAMLATPSPNVVPNGCVSEQIPTRSANRYKLSYEDYLQQWKTIGTTQPGVADTTKSPHIHVQKSSLVSSHGEMSDDSLQSQVYPSDSCTGDKSKRQRKTEQLKATRVQLLKDIRGNKKGGMDMCIPLPVSPDETLDDEFDIDNTEANSLLSWTENLPID